MGHFVKDTQAYPSCSSFSIGINSLSTKHKYVWNWNLSSLLTKVSKGIVFLISTVPISSDISLFKLSQGVSVPEEMMYWYVIPGTVPDSDGSIPDQMIETVCKQTYDVSPGDGGTSTVQYGDRDFSSNFSVAAAHEEETFTIPSNMQCQEQDQVDNETHSKYGVFGPVLF